MTEPAHVPDTHAAVPNERSVKILWDEFQMYQVLRCTQLCTCQQTVGVYYKLDMTGYENIGYKGGEPELSEQWNSAIEVLNRAFIRHTNGVLGKENNSGG